jgi:TonB-linked SusC/RagA family outer membrane protein
MKKNECISWEWKVPRLQKVFRIMKLTVFLVLLSVISVFASKTYSQTTVLNLDLENSTVKEVLRNIEKQSEFVFMYSEKLIDVTREVSVTVRNKKIYEVLDELFAGTNVEYKVKDRFVLLVTPEITVNDLIIQQQNTVSGTVTDESDQPLPGVTVVVKSTTQGTVTNADGNYSLTNIPENATLVFSFVGMRTQEVEVGNQTNINITMEFDAIGIEEVIAVGYGTQKKVNLTGAVGVANGEVLENRPITNVLEGLQGAVAGLNITNANGEPGSNPKINIRGATSINGGNPLILVDGIEMNLNDLNPNDIESISVLKDAASSAMYGARAAYGVILVTTKSAKYDQKTRVEYSSNFYAAQPTILAQKSNSLKFALYANEMRRNRQTSDAIVPEEFELIKQRVNGEIDRDFTRQENGTYYLHANTNWSDQVYSDAAPGQNHNLSVSGGSEKMYYRISLGYIDYDGVVKIGNDNYKQINTNLKVNADLASWAKLNFQVNLVNTNRNLVNLPSSSFGPSIHHVIWRARPTWAPYFEDPEYDVPSGPVFVRLNPVSVLDQAGRNISKGLNTRYKAGIELDYGDFNIISNFIYNPSSGEVVINNKEIFQVIPWQANFQLVKDASTYSAINKIYSRGEFFGFDAYANYEKRLNEHYVKATFGYDQRWSVAKTLNGFRKNLISEDIHSITNATDEYPTITDSHNEWALRSGFFRVNYSFKDRYLLEVNGRYDGSSRFIEKDRFGFFPSVSAGWRISEEQFMQNLKSLDNLKLRVSYGSLGNQNVSGLYPYSDYSTTSQINLIFNGMRPMGVYPDPPLGNERTWEVVTSLNFGVDATLFEGLDISFDKFTRTTKNMLVSGNALPAVYGTTAPQENNADLEVKGWEASLQWSNKIGKVGYHAGFSISDWQGKITKFDNPTKSFSKPYYVGQNINEIWGFVTEGLFQSEDEVANYFDASALGSKNALSPGDVKYMDLDGNEILNYGENTADNPGDLKIIGNSTPRYAYSISAGADWKGIDLSLFLQGIGKRDFWLDGPIMFGGKGDYGNMIITDYLFDNMWSDGSNPDIPENRDAYYFKPSEGSGKGVVNYNSLIQTRYLQDASYLRLKNITLGYTLPFPLTKKVKIEKCRFYVSGENLLTFTNLNPNFDPEVLIPNESGQGSVSSSSTSTNGLMGKAYPLTKRISFGMNITF